MIVRPILLALLLGQLLLWPRESVAAVPGCPQLVIPISPSHTAVLEAPPNLRALLQTLIATSFNLAYNAWAQRLGQPDIVVRSDPDAWREVPEFVELVRVGRLYLPYLREKLQVGDFRAVLVVECVTGLSSDQLYPTPLPAPGSFGLQDVAKLWLMNGGPLIENACKAGCSANAACEQKCVDDRQQYWGP